MSQNENEYFAQEEIEKKRKLAIKQREELEKQQREEQKKLHHMKCPKCGMDLQTLHRGTVEIDTCFHCRGVWLDEGELEALIEHGKKSGSAVMEAVLNIFKKK